MPQASVAAIASLGDDAAVPHLVPARSLNSSPSHRDAARDREIDATDQDFIAGPNLETLQSMVQEAIGVVQVTFLHIA